MARGEKRVGGRGLFASLILFFSACSAFSAVNGLNAWGDDLFDRLFEGDPDPDDSVGVDHVDVFAVGDLDHVVGLVGDQHGVADLEEGVVEDAAAGGEDVGEGDGAIAIAAEFPERLA